MVRINIDIPDDLHERLKMLASAEGKGFYEWLKEDLTQTCPDELTFLQMLEDIRRERSDHALK
jgi:predicted DNA-binding protein